MHVERLQSRLSSTNLSLTDLLINLSLPLTAVAVLPSLLYRCHVRPIDCFTAVHRVIGVLVEAPPGRSGYGQSGGREKEHWTSEVGNVIYQTKT